MTTPVWSTLQPQRAKTLSDTRRQLHHAAQLATALGISYLPHQADDSHTNLEWLEVHRALASNSVNGADGAVRIAVRMPDLTLLVLRDNAETASRELLGGTISQAADWVRSELEQHGLHGTAYTLARHYEIPAHAVASGVAFSANRNELEELARWFGNAALVLADVQRANRGAPVRCWPHHFDIATLITVREGATVGVGLEPGDNYYDEPYFYVNAYPSPRADALTAALDGGGQWHTHEWVGAVLPAARLTDDATQQENQVRAFLASGATASRALLR